MKKELQKAMLIGMFLSKFDKKALAILGFKTFTEAYNVLGLGLGVKPLSIRNYRDEFDPFFPNKRKGWHKRPMLQTRKELLGIYKNLSINKLSNLVKEVIYKNPDIDLLDESIEFQENSENTFAKRLITGQAAEQYFENNFQTIELFKNFQLDNTTKLGCGFDFKLCLNKIFYAIEVKGLQLNSGKIMLTQKEHRVATSMRNNYFIFVVRNFIDKPIHNIFRNPVFNNKLEFNKKEVKVTQINWTAKV